MPRFRTALALTLAALATVPAAASVHARAQVLRDVTPLGGGYFKDRVFVSSARTAHAAATAHFSSYPLKEGGSMKAAISSRYGDQLSTDVAQSYVDYLDSLDHGPEL